MKKVLDIGEVCRLTGLPPSTLRFYEERGLIGSIGRSGLRRLFDQRVLKKLQFVAMGQRAGFSLDEISAMFNKDDQIQIDRNVLLHKVAQIDSHIKQLIAIRNTIQHVANCSARNHLECPKFQKLLRLAGKKMARVRNTKEAST